MFAKEDYHQNKNVKCNHENVYRALVLDSNTQKHITLSKLFVLYRNT